MVLVQPALGGCGQRYGLQAWRGGYMRKALDTLFLWAGYAAGVLLVIIFTLMMAMAVGREFGLNIPSGDDFASWAMAGLSFLGLAHTFKRGEMIRVGLLLERLKGRTRPRRGCMR